MNNAFVARLARTVPQTARETIPIPRDIIVKCLSSLHFTPVRNTFQALCLDNPKTETLRVSSVIKSEGRVAWHFAAMRALWDFPFLFLFVVVYNKRTDNLEAAS